VDFYLSARRDREAAELFLKKALANPDNRHPHVFARDGLRSYSAALRELQAEGRVARRCRERTRRYCNNRIESDHRYVKRRLRAMQGPRLTTTAWAVIQGIEAAYMIRKGQGLGITRRNLTSRRGCSEPCSASDNQPSSLRAPHAWFLDADATLPGREIRMRRSRRTKNAADNVSPVSVKYGNSETYLLRRLKRDHKELAEKVVAAR
jgi:DDE domain